MVEEVLQPLPRRFDAIGLNLDDDARIFTKNRDRLLEAQVAQDFLVHLAQDQRIRVPGVIT